MSQASQTDKIPSRPSGCLPDLQGRKVLVVADEPDCRDLLFEMIELWGGRCLEAANAQQALALARSLLADAATLDLIIIDLNSPCAQGIKTARLLAAEPLLAKIPMLFLNGEPCPSQESTGLHGAFCVEKPLRLVDLQDAVSKVLCGRVFNFPRRSRAWLSTGRTALPQRILLVEESSLNQELTRTLLEKRGHRVTSTCDGGAAWQMLQERTFDLILMDAKLPVMDGPVLMKNIRGSLASPGSAHIPVIALIVHACEQDKREMLAAGADACIAKPFQVHDLLATVERFSMDHVSS